jgi:hypothetical protein
MIQLVSSASVLMSLNITCGCKKDSVYISRTSPRGVDQKHFQHVVQRARCMAIFVHFHADVLAEIIEHRQKLRHAARRQEAPIELVDRS